MQVGHLVIIALGALGAMAGNPFVRKVFLRLEMANRGRGAGASSDDGKYGLLLGSRETFRGGRAIGVLERLAVYLCLVFGFPEGVAMVLAIKGLGRYPELRNGNDSRIGELFIIGTFLSILWSVLWVGVVIGVGHLLECFFVN